MSRSKWKGNFVKKFILKDSFILKKKTKIWSRNSSIPFFLINKFVFVYNGKFFKKLYISREKIGFKFGEFVFTKKIPKVSKKKKN